MRLPRRIRISYKEVELVRKVSLADNEGAYGKFHSGNDGTQCRIEYDAKLRGKELLQTIMHEINHAIFETYIPAGTIENTRISDAEELFADASATGWTQVLSDNPALMRWITEKADNGRSKPRS